MRMRFMLLLGGVVLLALNLAMASSVMPGMGTGGHSLAQPLSNCVGDFSAGIGVCTFFEEPTDPEQQDFSLGTPTS